MNGYFLMNCDVKNSMCFDIGLIMNSQCFLNIYSFFCFDYRFIAQVVRCDWCRFWHRLVCTTERRLITFTIIIFSPWSSHRSKNVELNYRKWRCNLGWLLKCLTSALRWATWTASVNKELQDPQKRFLMEAFNLSCWSISASELHLRHWYAVLICLDVLVKLIKQCDYERVRRDNVVIRQGDKGDW